MSSRKSRFDDSNESHLPFDATQEIDTALADQLRRTTEPTLTQVDFEDITVVLTEETESPPVALRA